MASEGEGTAYSINFAVFDSVGIFLDNKYYTIFKPDSSSNFHRYDMGLIDEIVDSNQKKVCKRMSLTEKIIKERDSLYRNGLPIFRDNDGTR